MAGDEIERRLRALEIEDAVKEQRLAHLERMMAEMVGDIKAIRSAVDGATGGWRLAVLIGIPSLITAGLTSVAHRVLGSG